MFLELRNGDDTQPLENALADDRVTVMVGRTADFLNVLQVVGERDDHGAFLIEDGVLSPETFERWFGDDDSVVLVLLNFDAPDRTAAQRYDINAVPFQIGQDLLNLEADQ